MRDVSGCVHARARGLGHGHGRARVCTWDARRLRRFGCVHVRVVLRKMVAWSGALDVTLVGIISVGGMEFAMVALLIVLAAVVLLAVVLVARASRLKPTEVSDPLPQSDAVGDDAAVERFREMLRCPTVWGMRDPDADRAAFDDFVPLLRKLYPRVFDELELEMIDDYGISLLWLSLIHI